MAYIQGVLQDLRLEGLKLSQLPLFYQLCKTKAISPPLSGQLGKISSLSHQTVVTPQVYILSMVLFQQSFKVVRSHLQHLSKLGKYPSNVEEIYGASPLIEWIDNPSLSSIYPAVKIGKTIYKVCTYFYSLFQTYIKKGSLEMLLLCFLEKILTKLDKEMPKHQVLKVLTI
jgi:hypothetical protein